MGDSNNRTFVDVILPLALPNLLTYSLPDSAAESVVVGSLVLVPLGKKKQYTALVRKVHNERPRVYHAKSVLEVLQPDPVVAENHLLFWEWVSKYYLCTMGEVMKTALPSYFSIASETVVGLMRNATPHSAPIDIELDEKGKKIVDALRVENNMSISKLSNRTAMPISYKMVADLLKKEVIEVREQLKAGYVPKKERFIGLQADFEHEERLKKQLDDLVRAPKQLALLMSFLHAVNWHDDTYTKGKLVSQKELLKDSKSSSAVLSALVKKGVFEVHEKPVDRLAAFKGATTPIASLSDAQSKAIKQIRSNWQSKDTVLLMGVTSSGKTEIYMHLIDEVIQRGKQVLYLLPEIALTAQIITRLQAHFGADVGVYHSRFSQNEKLEIWERVQGKRANPHAVILGARSALFLPFQDLGLIIVDEEHEATFKQYDPAPRYHARDSAIVLAAQFGAKVLLGSATPSLESFHNVELGKYGSVELKERYGGVQPPQIKVIDLAEQRKKKEMKSMFSSDLITAIEQTLRNKEQVILFKNRRGYAPMQVCRVCGWSPQCERCDVSLTFHKSKDALHCHYCGNLYKQYTKCKACGSSELELVGFGTEKVEEELQLIIPGIRIGRMDLDATRKKGAHQRLIQQFEAGQIDVLVGTQMVTKGLDFDNVAVVGILNADPMLKFPDFRAFEKTFQVMTQVAGRAGRKKKRGKVLVQTYHPDHWVIQNLLKGDIHNFYGHELRERKAFQYAPFTRLIRISLKHKEQNVLDKGAHHFTTGLRNVLESAVLGPEYPLIPRIRNYYQKDVLLKLDKTTISIDKTKEWLTAELEKLRAHDHFKSIRAVVDVDPL